MFTGSTRRRALVFKALACITCVTVCGCDPSAIGKLSSRASTNFVFPESEAKLLGYLTDPNGKALTRRHAWELWHMINSGDPSKPAWRGWNEADQKALANRDDGFRTLIQLNGLTTRPPQHNCDVNDACVHVCASVHYNKPLLRWVENNRFNDRNVLDELNHELDQMNVPACARDVSPAPRHSIAIKPIWAIVKKGQPLTLPVWEEAVFRACSNGLITAPTYLWGKRTEEISWKDLLSPTKSPMFAFAIDEDAAEQINAKNVIESDISDKCSTPFVAEEGDVLALIGMHLATKELDDWVWATFWWHPDPDIGEYGSDRPQDLEWKTPWKNYLMDVTFQVKPLAGSGVDPDADDPCMNPWLEARMAKGIGSNCIGCHQYAAWRSRRNDQPGTSVQDRSVVHSKFASKCDSNFENAIRTDYLWSLVPENDKKP